MGLTKKGYVIIDCNTTDFDVQPIYFLLEYTSVLCITISGTITIHLDEAFEKCLTTLSYLGRYDVPVVKGVNLRNQYEIMSDSAAREIERITHKFPNKVTIVCLGPLGNVASAVLRNRMISRLVKKVIFVADGFDGRKWIKNYNIKADMESSRIVFCSRIPLVVLPSSLTSLMALSEYFSIRDGFHGILSSIFNKTDTKHLAVSQKVFPGYVILTKVAASLIVIQPESVLIKESIIVNEEQSDDSLSISQAESSCSFGASRNKIVLIRKVCPYSLKTAYKQLYSLGIIGRSKQPY